MSKHSAGSDLTKYSSAKKDTAMMPGSLVSASYVTIQQAAGNFWTGLLICQKCKIKPSSYALHGVLMELHCSKCNTCQNCSAAHTIEHRLDWSKKIVSNY